MLTIRRILAILLAASVILCSYQDDAFATAYSGYWTDDGIAATSFEGGNGTEVNPYLIANAAQLGYLAKLVNGGMEGSTATRGNRYRLADNIDLAGRLWVPIGLDLQHGFNGYFDGAGFTVSGMRIVDKSSYVGLFGFVGDLTGISDYERRIANLSVSGEIELMDVRGRNTQPQGAGSDCCGIAGIAGMLYGSAQNCRSDVQIKLTFLSSDPVSASFHCSIGGMTGSAVEVSNCSSAGRIDIRFTKTSGQELPELTVGGISAAMATVRNSYSTMDITVASGYDGALNIGGIKGEFEGVFNCYGAGAIQAEDTSNHYVGNILGFAVRGGGAYPNSIASCYWPAGKQIGNDGDGDGVGSVPGNALNSQPFGGNAPNWICSQTGDHLVDRLNRWVRNQNDAELSYWREATSMAENGGYPVFGSGQEESAHAPQTGDPATPRLWLALLAAAAIACTLLCMRRKRKA